MRHLDGEGVQSVTDRGSSDILTVLSEHYPHSSPPGQLPSFSAELQKPLREMPSFQGVLFSPSNLGNFLSQTPHSSPGIHDSLKPSSVPFQH